VKETGEPIGFGRLKSQTNSFFKCDCSRETWKNGKNSQRRI